MIMSDLQSTSPHSWFPAILNVFDGFIPRSTFITINVHISHSVCVDPPLFDRFPPKKSNHQQCNVFMRLVSPRKTLKENLNFLFYNLSLQLELYFLAAH